jgi:putative chitinase
MSYQVTALQLLNLNSNLTTDVAAALAQGINDAAAKYGMDQTPRRMRYFVAQTFFETASYTSWSENLNYTTPERLVAVWPSRFTMTMPTTLGGLSYAPDYTSNPQALANLVYANRGGNGDQASGDGWNFRGRGGLGLTFRDNYAAYDAAVYGDGHIVANPDLVAAPEDAMMSAGWFWSNNNINALADQDAFTQATQVINGSTTTVPQRLPVLNKVNATLQWSS